MHKPGTPHAVPPQQAPEPPPESGTASAESRERLRTAIAAADDVAAEAWCRREKNAQIWSLLRRALRALGR